MVAASPLWEIRGQFRDQLSANTTGLRADWTSPIAQEFQAVLHVSRGLGFADVYQSPQFLPNGDGLLVADDDASVVTFLPQELGMKPTKIGCIVGVEGASLLEGPGQLCLVQRPQKSALAAGSDIPSPVAQPVQQSMGVGIFIQMKL